MKNLTWSKGKISYKKRCELMNQKGIVLWFTGLSGSGKSTLSIELEKKLFEKKLIAYRLDGDNVRHGLNSDLGFSDSDRNENIRRVIEVANLFKDAAIITLVAFISPFEEIRKTARKKIGNQNFIEIYVKASVETCIKRDPKGLYKKVKSGKIKDFTGFDSQYEIPKKPELVIDTEKYNVDECVQQIMDYLKL